MVFRDVHQGKSALRLFVECATYSDRTCAQIQCALNKPRQLRNGRYIDTIVSEGIGDIEVGWLKSTGISLSESACCKSANGESGTRLHDCELK